MGPDDDEGSLGVLVGLIYVIPEYVCGCFDLAECFSEHPFDHPRWEDLSEALLLWDDQRCGINWFATPGTPLRRVFQMHSLSAAFTACDGVTCM